MGQSNYFSDTNTQINTKESVKDLGIILCSDMTYKNHIETVCQKVKGISAWICRTFKSRDAKLMLTLWKSLVIPHLDYCSQLWSPSTRHLMVKLEMLQKSFLDRILSLNHLNYWEKLEALKLYSLERRRERYRILYTWYILEQLVPNFNFDGEVGGIHCSFNQRLGRKCKPNSVGPRSKRNLWKGSLSQEGPKLFNVLPMNLRNTSNCFKDVFKKQLDDFLRSVPDEPLLPNLFVFRRGDSNSLTEMVNHRTPRVG